MRSRYRGTSGNITGVSLVASALAELVANRDPDLGDKLKAEWPDILQWMIDGCLDWQKQGLAPPESVTAATDAYLEAQDTFSAWLDECCELDPNGWERSMALFASWKGWAEQSGQFVGGQDLPRPTRMPRWR